MKKEKMSEKLLKELADSIGTTKAFVAKHGSDLTKEILERRIKEIEWDIKVNIYAAVATLPFLLFSLVGIFYAIEQKSEGWTMMSCTIGLCSFVWFVAVAGTVLSLKKESMLLKVAPKAYILSTLGKMVKK